ncbi:MAG TPA: hypothetical protein VNK45_05445 [Candidatus Acidoferrales bacterium]|nr:hypothetical protein [Candidatus Acidoferrales bacterium]
MSKLAPADLHLLDSTKALESDTTPECLAMIGVSAVAELTRVFDRRGSRVPFWCAEPDASAKTLARGEALVSAFRADGIQVLNTRRQAASPHGRWVRVDDPERCANRLLVAAGRRRRIVSDLINWYAIRSRVADAASAGTVFRDICRHRELLVEGRSDASGWSFDARIRIPVSPENCDIGLRFAQHWESRHLLAVIPGWRADRSASSQPRAAA